MLKIVNDIGSGYATLKIVYDIGSGFHLISFLLFFQYLRSGSVILLKWLRYNPMRVRQMGNHHISVHL